MDYKKAIMKMDEQEVDDSQIDLEQQQQQEKEQSNKDQCKYTVVITISIIGFLVLLVYFGVTIASQLTPLPKVYIEYHQQAYFPDSNTYNTNKRTTVQESPNYSFDAFTRQILINQPSPANLVEIQAINSAHRRYQKTLRFMQASNSHTILDKYANERFSEYSSMSYKTYLQALDSLQLTTFAIDDFSLEYSKLSNQQRLYYSQKYQNNAVVQNQICVVLTLTQEGLQSQQYYLAIKSIFQQEYSNFRVVVLNYPSMNMLDEVQKLLRQYRSSKITLLDKVEKEKEKIGNAFYVNGIVRKYCKDTKLTLLLHDRGELIGQQAFKTINKIYLKQQPSIIFSHYILEPINPLRSASQTFRYKVQLYPPNLSNSRNQAYKTKYLKVYSTQMLLKMDEKVMKRMDGTWMDGLFQSNLQFSMMEFSCQKYYLLDQILYMATKHDIQSAFQVHDARMHDKLNCYLDNKQKEVLVLPKKTKIPSISPQTSQLKTDP